MRHRELRHDLLAGPEIEATLIVPLVHRPPLPVQTPGTKFRQRAQDVRHQAPTKLEPFKNATTPHVPAQQDGELTLEKPRVPGHAHARLQVAHLLNALAKPKIVNQPQETGRHHLLHRRRENQMACLINGMPLQLFSSSAGTVLGTPRWILTRGSRRIHAVSRFVATQQAHAIDERRHVLRKRYHVLAELRQPRPLHCHETHLHVLQRQKHGLCQGGLREQKAKLLARETEHRIHVVSERELRHHLLFPMVLSQEPPLSLQVNVAPTAHT